jgi:RNA polymerase-binding transcription factor DksA
MPDDADRAQVQIEREAERLLESARRVHRVYSDRCIDCGDWIPTQRREYGLCIDCAEDRERLERHAGLR